MSTKEISSLHHGDKSSSNQEYRRKAQNAAFHSYGTYIIFKKREALLNKCLVGSFALNILVPSILGAICISFGVNVLSKEFSLVICGLLSFTLTVLTLLSYILKWQEKWYEARQNMFDNYDMYQKYKDIADDLTLDKDTFELLFDKLKIDSKYIDRRSIESGIKDKEKVFGHRNALLQFQRKCASCGENPTDMKPTQCPICGQF